MNNRNSRTILISVQFYTFMVKLYPADFREAYGELMVQLFRDHCRLTYQHKSIIGISAVWVHTLADFLLTLFEQYANRGVMMTKSSWIKLSGWFLATSSLFFLTAIIASNRPQYSEFNFLSKPVDKILHRIEAPFMIIGLLFITIGLMGLTSRFGSKADKIGKIGLGLALLGGGSSSIGIIGSSIADQELFWILMVAGTFLIFLGLGLFGINCLRAKFFSRWNAVPLLISIPLTITQLVAFIMDTVLGVSMVIPDVLYFLILFLSFGGLTLIGYLVFSENTRNLTMST